MVKHHGRREAAANGTTSATATNGTYANSMASGVYSAASGGSSSSVPVGDSGRDSGDGNNGRGGGRKDAIDNGGGRGGVGTQASPLSPSPSYAPQCVVWADTVLSTEGHLFLVNTLATAAAGGGAGGIGGDLSHSSEKERHKTGESNALCSPSSSHSSSNTDSHCARPSSGQATVPTATVRQESPLSSPTLAVPASSVTPLKIFSGSKFDRLKDVFRLLRWRRREGEQTEKVTAATTADSEVRNGQDRGGEGRVWPSPLSSFNPRHHYSRAVRSERFVAGPKNGELDVKVRARLLA